MCFATFSAETPRIQMPDVASAVASPLEVVPSRICTFWPLLAVPVSVTLVSTVEPL
jgi:hypothetical protein